MDDQHNRPEPSPESGPAPSHESTTVAPPPLLSRALACDVAEETAFDITRLPTAARKVTWHGHILLIILAMLVACSLAVIVGRRAFSACWFNLTFTSTGKPVSYLHALYPLPWQQQQKLQLSFLLSGDKHRVTEAEQQRAIWEAHPENKAYFANYVSYLEKEKITTTKQLAHFEQEMRIGQWLDPQNALYHYLLADTLVRFSVDDSDHMTKKDKKTGHYNFPARIKDRGMLDRAMQEFRIGVTKPYLNTYNMEMIKGQVATLPSHRQLEDEMAKIILISRQTNPEYSHYRNLAFCIPFYAHTLAAEGKKQEAESFLQSYYPYIKQLTESADSLVGMLVNTAVMHIGEEANTDIDEEMGRHDLAEQAHAKFKHIRASVDTFRESVKVSKREYPKHWRNSAGWACGSILEVYGDQHYTDADFAPARYVEHVGIEELAVAAFPLLCCVFMLYLALVTLRWLITVNGKNMAPVLSGLPWQDTVRILLLGVVLPLVIYFIYSRWSGLAGRESNVSFIWRRMAVEFSLLGLVIIFLPGFLARRALRRHFQEIGMPVPPEDTDRVMRVRGNGGALIWMIAATVIVSHWLTWLVYRLTGREMAMPHLVTISAFVALAILFIPLLWERKWMQYASYCGTLARSIATLQAITVLFLALVIYPMLTANERALLRSDHLFYFPGRMVGMGISPLEDKVVKRLRDDTLAALRAEWR